MHGLQRSLVIALAVSLLTTAVAAFVGAAAAYLGGIAEKAVLEVIHFLLVVPSFLSWRWSPSGPTATGWC